MNNLTLFKLIFHLNFFSDYFKRFADLDFFLDLLTLRVPLGFDRDCFMISSVDVDTKILQIHS